MHRHALTHTNIHTHRHSHTHQHTLSHTVTLMLSLSFTYTHNFRSYWGDFILSTTCWWHTLAKFESTDCLLYSVDSTLYHQADRFKLACHIDVFKIKHQEYHQRDCGLHGDGRLLQSQFPLQFVANCAETRLWILKHFIQTIVLQNSIKLNRSSRGTRYKKSLFVLYCYFHLNGKGSVQYVGCHLWDLYFRGGEEGGWGWGFI